MSEAPGPVLVLDADSQAGLYVLRSLGRRGVSVTAGSHRLPSLGGLSRYSDGTYRHPDPEQAVEAFVAHLVDYLETVPHFAVVPVRDRTSLVLAKHKARIEATGATAAIEDWSRFGLTYDKGRLFALAEPLGVPTPETFDPGSLAAVEELAPEVPYPAVVKPRSKTVLDDSGRCHYTEIDDGHYVDGPDELVEAYRRVLARNPVLEARGHHPLVQEYVEGETTTTVVLAEAGEVVAHFQERRLRTYPESGGYSTLVRGIDDPSMLAHAEEVIRALEWTGPAMVEFMRTPGGEHHLIEVNGRYWGSVPLAIESGVDVPWMHFQQLRGREVSPPASYRRDVLYHRLFNEDLLWLADRLRDGDPTAPFTVLRSCIAADRSFVSLADPVPTLWAPVRTLEAGVRAAVDRLRDADPENGTPG
jgi:predicted ATP-grasp superfamily ATP-dependent carboligase